MKLAQTIGEIRAAVGDARREAAKVALVPTMGALHEGHYSLIEAARRQCDFVVVSIFVNPTQFAPGEDYDRYPRSLEADLAGCRARGVDAVFAPSVTQMYPGKPATMIHVAGLTEHLCGAARPGHFDGVCTVVAKLFNIVIPDVAYFGAKDYQQAVVIRRMVADLDMATELVVCPTVREADGLAASTRNSYLSPAQRTQAPALYGALRAGMDVVRSGGRRADDVAQAVRKHLAKHAPEGCIDYVEVIDPDGLDSVQHIEKSVVIALAVRFGSVRLIDNIRVDLSAAGRVE